MRRGGRGWTAHALVAAAALGWTAFATPAVLEEGAAPALAQTESAPFATWPLADLTGGVAVDTVGHLDGRAAGGVVSGQVGQGPGVMSSRFYGSGMISVPTDGLTPTAVAAGAWVETTYADGSGTIVDTGAIALDLVSTHPVATACAASMCTRAVSPVAVADGAWHYVMASADAGVTTLFVDGVAVAQASGTAPTATPGAPIVIGRGLRGNIDAVSIYQSPVNAAAVDTSFRAGACPQMTTMQAVAAATRRLPALPLHTRGRYVVDEHGHRVKLAGVNWYGAEELDRVPAGLQCQTADAIAAQIVAGGFNVVRLPWATTTWTGPTAPAVPPIAVAANPQLRGRGARAVFDAVVAALARHGLMVVLDNHVTRADWCCSGSDGNALWWEGYDPTHPPAWQRMNAKTRLAYFHAGQSRWMQAWRTVVRRYRTQRAVIGVDLRNEPRPNTLLGLTDRWGGRHVPVWSDWPLAATHAGNSVLRLDPHLLVVVEGSGYATNLRAVAERPVRLSVAHRLVYSAHDYSWENSATTATGLRRELNRAWGWLLVPHRGHTTPVWVGEFGTCHPEASWCSERAWFRAFTSYLRSSDVDWAYWSINGTGARGTGAPATCSTTPRFPGCDEGYGLSDATWSHEASSTLSATLRSVATPAARG